MSFFQKMDKNQAYLNRALNDLVQIFKSEEFNQYLIASDLSPIAKISGEYAVHKGYPKGNPNRYEVYVNTSNRYQTLDLDIAQAQLLLTVAVDVFIPDNALPYIWIYQSAYIQWLLQFSLGDGTILGIGNQTYTIAEGDTANHFVMVIDVLANSYTDEDI